MTQSHLIAGFRDYLQYERRYSLHTLDGYIRDVTQFTDFIAFQYTITNFNEVNHHHARSWAVSLLKDNVQGISVRRKLSAIAHFYKWLRRLGKADHNPLLKVQLPKIPERLPKSLPESQIRMLWDYFDNNDQGDIQLLRDRTMVSLLYGCGLRRSEMINLKWQDVDISRRTLRIFGKGRKYRQVPVTPEVFSILSGWKAVVEKKWPNVMPLHVIVRDNGEPCYPKFVHNRVVAMLGIVTTAGRKSPHVLRHSMATHLMDQGATLNAVKELLGHATLAATQVYTHNSIARLKDVYRQSHPKSDKS